MQRRGQTTTYQERLQIGERAATGQADAAIAATLGCARWTARTWRRRYRRLGGRG